MSLRKVNSKTGSRTNECPGANMRRSCVSQATVIEMNGNANGYLSLDSKRSESPIPETNFSLFTNEML